MRDFPFFTTEYGIAGLILKEIPYRQTAYIRIREASREDIPDLLRECAAFCRMAGADRIYVTGHECLGKYPLHCAVLEMRGQARVEREKLSCLFPVTEGTVSRWREVYNRAMAPVDNSATLEARDEKDILSSGGAYFIHREGNLLGIGWMEGTKLLAVAGTEKGAGETVMHTLMSLIEGADMTLEVASTNERAIALYERLGFVKTKELTRWHDVSNQLSF